MAWVCPLSSATCCLLPAACRAQYSPGKGGSEKKYGPRPNRLWGHPKGPFGTPEPHLSSPVLPWIPLSVENHCFGTLGQSASFRRRYLSQKKCQTSTSNGDGQRGCPRGPGNRGGHGLSRVDNASPCTALKPTTTRMHAAVVVLQPSRLCSPYNHTARQGRPLGSY